MADRSVRDCAASSSSPRSRSVTGRAFSRAAAALLVLGAFAAAASPGAAPAVAQTYPTRSITVVSPYVAGGTSSLLARTVGIRLEQRLGRPIVIENRPGGGTVTGALSVAHAQPDGYTLFIAPDATLATNVTLYRSLPYDPVADFVPLALVARVPEVLVVNAGLPLHSLADIAALAKTRPGGLTYGSAGVGSGQHINGATLAMRLGVPMTHIPYRGIAPALNDTAGGHIDLMFSDIPISMPLIMAGKLRAIGVTTAVRVAALPDVPPLAEVGLAGFDEAAWFMFLAPAKTPRDIVDKLSAAMREALREPGLRDDFVRLGLLPVDSPDPTALQSFMRSEIARAGDIVRAIGLAGIEQTQ